MWQFSLYFQKEIFFYIKDLQESLRQTCSGQKCCIRIFSKDDMFVLILALPKKVYEKQILFIKEQIIKSILFYYKPKTIIEELDNFSTDNFSNRMLLDILCNFDSKAETDEIFKKLSLCDKLYLSSFVQFSLRELSKNWKEMARLINQNSKFLNDECIKSDLMRFLLNGISSKANIIDISKNKNQIRVLRDNNIISSFDNIFYFVNDFDKLLFMIICNYPKVITIKNYREFDARFINCIYSLYGDRLKLFE